MRVSLLTMMELAEHDRKARRCIKRWIRLSSIRPYDREIVAIYMPERNKFAVELV